MESDALIAARHKRLEGILDERQRRLHAAVEAKVLGHGGVKRVSAATGVARGSILAGMKELDLPQAGAPDSPRRVRRGTTSLFSNPSTEPAGLAPISRTKIAYNYQRSDELGLTAI